MKKFVNLRIPVILALSLCAGIVLAIFLYFYGYSIAWCTLSLLPAVGILIIVALKRRKILRPLVYVILSTALFIAGSLNCYYSLSKYDKSQIDENAIYSVSGKVVEKGYTSSGEYIIVTNVTVDGNKIDGKLYVYLSPTYGELCDVGYTIKFSGTLEKLHSFSYGELNYYAERNIKYRSAVYSGLQSTYKFSFFGSVRSAIRERLFGSLGYETAAISYAMLVGNTQFIEDSSLDSFRYGGVAHIFAISGLHIALVFAIINTILKKFGVNKYISAVISICTIVFYSAVCGFTLSSVRAVIMCTVAVIAKLMMMRYDELNSLSIAAVVILCITPLSLFSVGFQLSICAVGGIICLSKSIERLLVKIKIPQQLSSVIAAALSAQLGTLPIMLANFGYLSGAGLLLNIIIIPIMSVIFAVMFIAALLSLIIPPAAALILPIAALPLEFIISFFVGAGFENSLISGFGAGLFAPLYFLSLAAITDKINIKISKRVIAIACSIVILSSYVLIRRATPFVGYTVTVSSYYQGGEVVIKSNSGTVLIVTDDAYFSRLNDMLNEHYINRIDAIIIVGEDSAAAFADIDIDCENVYVCNYYPQIQPYGDIYLNYVTDFSICGIDFTFFDRNTLLAKVDGVELGVCADAICELPQCDILISDSQLIYTDYGVKVSFNSRSTLLNVAEYGDLSFKIEKQLYQLIKIPPRL